jgi:DNA-binding NarL/FixJ family response regulator
MLMAKALPEGESAIIKVLVVDDHRDLCELLEMAINSERDMKMTTMLHRADDVLQEIERDRPHILIIDLCMPGRQPLSVIREVSDRYPQTRSIAFSAYDDQETVNEAMAAGAAGYISKMQGLQSIMAGVRKVINGEAVSEIE